MSTRSNRTRAVLTLATGFALGGALLGFTGGAAEGKDERTEPAPISTPAFQATLARHHAAATKHLANPGVAKAIAALAKSGPADRAAAAKAVTDWLVAPENRQASGLGLEGDIMAKIADESGKTLSISTTASARKGGVMQPGGCWLHVIGVVINGHWVAIASNAMMDCLLKENTEFR